MFTGIIEEIGVIKDIERYSRLLRLGIAASFADDVKIGDSIAVNGVCLTIIELGDRFRPGNSFSGNLSPPSISAAGCPHRVIYFDVMEETLKTTNILKLKLNDKVNLEQALKAGDRLGGHFVTGHIDTVAMIRKKTNNNGQAILEISMDPEFMDGIVDRGSIAVDGISLTVAEKKKDLFIVCVIPHTLKATTLGFKSFGDTVNIELDLMAKYARQNIQPAALPPQSKITEEFLKEHGF